MKMPRNIGPVHFVGIGGIGMSGIAEILHNQGYKVHGSDSAESANVQRLRAMGIDVEVGQSADNLERRGRGRHFLGDQEGQSGAGRGALARPAGGAARRDAGRDHAVQERRCNRRHARQDDDHDAGRDAARCGQLRSDRHQWRHHQRLRHQCAARRRRVDGGRGRRERRHLRQAAGRRRRSSPISIPSISTTTTTSTTSSRRSSTSSRTCRSTALR